MGRVNRQPAGQPTGGQFAPNAKANAGVSLHSQDENFTVDRAQDFIEDMDLSHGNAEVFTQGGEVFITADGPMHSPLTFTVPIGASEQEIKDAFVDHAETYSADDEFSELVGDPDGAEVMNYITDGVGDIVKGVHSIPEGTHPGGGRPIEKADLERFLDDGGINFSSDGGVYEDSGGYLVDMQAPNGVVIRAWVPDGATKSQARQALIDAAEDEDINQRFSDAVGTGGEPTIGGLVPSELMDALKEDERHFKQVARHCSADVV